MKQPFRLQIENPTQTRVSKKMIGRFLYPECLWVRLALSYFPGHGDWFRDTRMAHSEGRSSEVPCLQNLAKDLLSPPELPVGKSGANFVPRTYFPSFHLSALPPLGEPNSHTKFPLPVTRCQLCITVLVLTFYRLLCHRLLGSAVCPEQNEEPLKV